MNPSLLLIPDRYKASKLYSQIPDSGAGDLAFTRSNDTATRVNSAGLIEKVRTNLYPRGSALLSTGWTSVDATLTAGQTDPNGGTTALRVELAAGGSPYSYIYQTFTGSAATYTRSVFIKGATAQTIRIVDPFTGAGSTINLTTSYQRFTAVAAGIPPSFGIQFDNNTDNGARDFTIAFVQIEEGDIATPYIPTTTAAVSVGPVADIPRIDYTGGGCGKLLLEPQRVNKWFFSEQFDNAEWLKTNVTFTANSAVSPDGFMNADKMVDTTANDEHRIRATSSLFTITTATTFSIFAKAAEYSKFAIADLTNARLVKFNLSTGSVISTGENWSNAKIENYGNGWYRLSATNGTNNTYGYGLLNDAGDFVFTGTGTKGVFIYGAQAEEAAYATSYIPTLGASVTRSADAASKTGISSLIGQSEGTIYWEFTFDTAVAAANEALLNIDNGSFGNTIYISKSAAGGIVGEMYVAGVLQASFSLSNQPAGTYKAALGYANNNTAFFVNGVQVGTTDTSCSVPATNRIQLGNGQLGPSTDKTSAVAIYTTRLSNFELQTLTTL